MEVRVNGDVANITPLNGSAGNLIKVLDLHKLNYEKAVLWLVNKAEATVNTEEAKKMILVSAKEDDNSNKMKNKLESDLIDLISTKSYKTVVLIRNISEGEKGTKALDSLKEAIISGEKLTNTEEINSMDLEKLVEYTRTNNIQISKYATVIGNLESEDN